MLPPNIIPVIAPLAVAFAINFAAELILLYSDKRFWIAAAKSAKTVIIPALIAAYALIIANIIGVGDMN